MSRYRRVKFGNKTAPEHRIIWEAAHGPIPEGYEIHHRNGNGKDNRLSNLLCLSRSEHVALHAQLRAYGNDPVDANDPDIKKSREGCR